jgi:hypothetical protein
VTRTVATLLTSRERSQRNAVRVAKECVLGNRDHNGFKPGWKFVFRLPHQGRTGKNSSERQTCLLKSDLGLAWKGWYVQLTNNNTAKTHMQRIRASVICTGLISLSSALLGNLPVHYWNKIFFCCCCAFLHSSNYSWLVSVAYESSFFSCSPSALVTRALCFASRVVGHHC